MKMTKFALLTFILGSSGLLAMEKEEKMGIGPSKYVELGTPLADAFPSLTPGPGKVTGRQLLGLSADASREKIDDTAKILLAKWQPRFMKASLGTYTSNYINEVVNLIRWAANNPDAEISVSELTKPYKAF